MMETIKDIIEVIVVAFLIALVVRGLIVETFVVHGLHGTYSHGRGTAPGFQNCLQLGKLNAATWSSCVTLLILQGTTSRG